MQIKPREVVLHAKKLKGKGPSKKRENALVTETYLACVSLELNL